MTVTENIKPKVVYEGTFEKGQVLYINFPYTNEEDIQCRVGTEDLIYNTEYTVEGQSITLQVDVTDAVLTIYRRTPLDQQANFPQNQRFDSAKINEALDKICMQQQEQREWLGRCVTADISNEGFNGELPVPQGDNVLKWNGDATALENYDIIGENNKFKDEVNQSFATLEAEIDNTVDAFKAEVTEMVAEVADAATKVNQLEAAVEEAKQAAITATGAEEQAETAASIAIHQADEVKEIRDTIIPTIQEEGQKQVENIERTGFFMRDNKLYFINSEGVEEEFKSGGGAGLEIGDIGIAPLGIDETQGKRRYLNGQTIIQEQYVQFTNKIKSAIELYPTLACTEEEWQTIATMSAFGACGKFVVDDEVGTIRLPKITGFIQGLNDLASLGGLVEAGLPNIDGSFVGGHFPDNLLSGAFAKTGTTSPWKYGGGSESFDQVSFNASTSNPIYNNSNTVQPESIRYPYFIQVATGAETEVNIINKIELNNPFSLLDSKYSPQELNNISWLKSEGQWNSNAIYPSVYELLVKIYNGTETKAGISVKLVDEEYDDYDYVLNPQDNAFRLPLLNGEEILPDHSNASNLDDGVEYIANKNGFIYVSRTTVQGNTGNFAEITINGQPYYGQYWNGPSGQNSSAILIPIKKGDVYKVTNTVNVVSAFRIFIPATGNGSLYFYVGETVQNANLVNVGRIEENMVTRQSLVECATVIETYSNEGSWYRVWSDGWCEQGGLIISSTNPYTVEFLKQYEQPPTLLACATTTSTTNPDGSLNIHHLTTTGFVMNYVAKGCTGFSWEAKGYLPEERIYD